MKRLWLRKGRFSVFAAHPDVRTLVIAPVSAGRLVLPWVMRMPADVSAAAGEHASHAMSAGGGAPWVGVLAVGAHTLAYLIIMSPAAWIVYGKLGLAFLRTAWFNLDWVWAGALVVTGLVVLLR